MTREEIKACCRKISPVCDESGECSFADNVQTLGFIDTSQGQNGSRGIVFSTNHIMLNLDGSPRIIFYRNINSVRIIDSCEDSFADELEIVCAEEEFRINNCSLNKAEFKSLLDKLCDGGLRGEGSARINPPPPKPPSTSIAVNIPPQTKPREKAPEPPRSAVKSEPGQGSSDITRNEPRRSAPESDKEIRNVPPREVPKAEAPKQTEPITDNADDIVFEDAAPVISETVIQENPEHSAVLPAKDDIGDSEMRVKIQSMTPEETMSFLAQSLSEINAPAAEEHRQEPPTVQTAQSSTPPAEAPRQQTINNYTAPNDQPKAEKLTVEPIWGDIYIKASRNLRELCESGRLSMKQIEAELSDKLLDSTRAFAEITADESKIPKVLIPKITELKAAAQNFDQYFQSGEDIAVRAMFFMLYQMLSYADRIVETPETKERLNDFFRRFGTAGITLSMLDMRV